MYQDKQCKDQHTSYNKHSYYPNTSNYRDPDETGIICKYTFVITCHDE